MGPSNSLTFLPGGILGLHIPFSHSGLVTVLTNSVEEVTLFNFWDWVIKGSAASCSECSHMEPWAHQLSCLTLQKPLCCEETKPHARASWRHLALQSWSSHRPRPDTRHTSEDASSHRFITSFWVFPSKALGVTEQRKCPCCTLSGFLTPEPISRVRKWLF